MSELHLYPAATSADEDEHRSTKHVNPCNQKGASVCLSGRLRPHIDPFNAALSSCSDQLHQWSFQHWWHHHHKHSQAHMAHTKAAVWQLGPRQPLTPVIKYHQLLRQQRLLLTRRLRLAVTLTGSGSIIHRAAFPFTCYVSSPASNCAAVKHASSLRVI